MTWVELTVSCLEVKELDRLTIGAENGLFVLVDELHIDDFIKIEGMTLNQLEPTDHASFALNAVHKSILVSINGH